MVNTAKSRILALMLALMLAFGGLAVQPVHAAGTILVDTGEAFLDALEDIEHSGTIRLIANITVNKHIELWKKQVIVELNGYTLDMVKGEFKSRIYLEESSLSIQGDGAFYISSGGGVSARTRSYLELTAARACSGVSATNESVLKIFEDVTFADDAPGPNSRYGITADRNSDITVGGSVLLDGDLDHGSIGAPAGSSIHIGGNVGSPADVGKKYGMSTSSGGTVVVEGNQYSGSVTATNGGLTHIKGNYYEPDAEFACITAQYGGTVRIDGDATTYYAQMSQPDSLLEIGGTLTATRPYQYAVDFRGGGTCNIYGDVIGGMAFLITDYGTAYVGGNIYSTGNMGTHLVQGTLTVDGEILEDLVEPGTNFVYARLNGDNKSIDHYMPVTTKEGYRTYYGYQCTLWVKDTGAAGEVPVIGMGLDHNELDLEPGVARQLHAIIHPENATNQDVTWSSDNPQVATVKDGLVTAVSSGTAVITATTADGGFTDTCIVTVGGQSDLPAAFPGTIVMKHGESMPMAIHMGQGDSQAASVSLSGFDPEIVRVSDDFFEGEGPHRVTVTGKNTGSTVITLGWSGGDQDGITQRVPVQVNGGSDSGNGNEGGNEGGNGSEGGNGGGTGGNGGSTGGSGGSSSGGSSSGSRSSSSSRSSAGAASGTGSARSGNINANGTVSRAAILSDLDRAIRSASGAKAVVVAKNPVSISPADLKALGDAAAKAGKRAVLHADTLSEDGLFTQARVYVEPARLTGLQGDLRLGVYTSGATVNNVKGHFQKWFSNKVQVVHCAQSGSFGGPVTIAAKVDVSDLDTASLFFYSFDANTNTYSRIESPAYAFDSNGYLHFTTESAGSIIITDTLLTAK